MIGHHLMLKSEVFAAIRETFTERTERAAAYSAISSVSEDCIAVLHWAYNASAIQVARYLGDHISDVEDCFKVSVWAEMNAREKREVVDGVNISIDPYNNLGRLCCQPYDSTPRLWCVVAYLGSREYALFNFVTGEYRIAPMDSMSALY